MLSLRRTVSIWRCVCREHDGGVLGIVECAGGLQSGSGDAVQHVHCSVQVTVPVFRTMLRQACSDNSIQTVGNTTKTASGSETQERGSTYRVASGANDSAVACCWWLSEDNQLLD
jgi:hypothetical protein